MNRKTISNREAHNRTCRFRKINKKGIRLALEVTHKCNFACSHCFVPKDIAHPSLEQLINVLGQLSEINCRKVILTGGEPLLREDLEQIIVTISRQNILVDLNSNLYLLNQKRLESLLEAGLQEISVSLYGTPDVHSKVVAKDNAYSKIIDNIKLVRSYDIPVDVHAGISEVNKGQIKYIAELCTQLGCDSLTFFSIIPSVHNKETAGFYEINKQELLQKISEIAKNFDIPINTIGLVPPDLEECTMCEAIIGLDANLNLKPCLLATYKGAYLAPVQNIKTAHQEIRNEVKKGLGVKNCVDAV